MYGVPCTRVTFCVLLSRDFSRIQYHTVSRIQYPDTYHDTCLQIALSLSISMVFGGGRHVRQLITVIYEWALVLDIHGQIDVTFLDFAKAFDSVPHEQLLLKADYY